MGAARHYTEGGVPADVLAPYHRLWLEHAVLLLEFENESRWQMLGAEEQSALIDELRRWRTALDPMEMHTKTM